MVYHFYYPLKLCWFLLNTTLSSVFLMAPKLFKDVSQAPSVSLRIYLFFLSLQRMWGAECRRLKALFGRYPDAEVYSFLPLIYQAMFLFWLLHISCHRFFCVTQHTRSLLPPESLFWSFFLIIQCFVFHHRHAIYSHTFPWFTFATYFISCWLHESLTELTLSWMAVPLGGYWRWNSLLVPQTVRYLFYMYAVFHS